MGVVHLFLATVVPALKPLLLTGVGLALASDRISLSGPATRHHFEQSTLWFMPVNVLLTFIVGSELPWILIKITETPPHRQRPLSLVDVLQLVFYVFSPALVLSNLAETITLKSLATVWFMPVNILFTFIIGSALALILIKITKTPPHLRGIVIGCCSAGNLGNLLLIIVPEACEEKNSPFGDSSVCSSYGKAYAAFSMAFGSIYIWSYVYVIMRVYANKSIKDSTTNDSMINMKSSEKAPETLPESCTETQLPSRDCLSSIDYSEQVDQLPCSKSEEKVKVSTLGKITQPIKKFAGQIRLKMLLNPSTIAAIIGFTIGLIPPLQKAMKGDTAPLHVIISATYLLGEAAIPLMTLIIGANLLKGLKKSQGGPLLIVGVIGVRYVILPMLGVVIVKAAHHFGMVGSSLLYRFILMLQYALPPAMNVGVISQLFEAGESECSVIMLWTYAVASFSLTIWSTFFIIVNMGLLDLFLVASMPVLKVLLLTALGLFLALDHIDVLGENARKQLNTLIFFVFNPALVGSNLSEAITVETIVLLRFMPLNILITFIIGSALGWILLKITRPPQHLKGLILGCCAAGNLGNLPVIIIPAVCKEKGSPFGAPAMCYTYGMAYASLSLAIGALFLWSYVYNIVRISTSKVHRIVNAENFTSSVKSTGGMPDLLQGRCSSSLVLIPQTDASTSPDHALKPKLPFTECNGEQKAPISEKIRHYLMTFSRKINLKALLSPSIIGAVIGFIIGMVPQLRKIMIGGSAPLNVVHYSASLLGDVALPTVTLIMGGNLLKGLKRSGTLLSVIIGIIAVRYVVLPIIGIVIVRGAMHYGLVHSDPLYQFVLLLQYAVPPAINIGTMTQMLGAGESECSVIMFWAYAFASVSLTLWSTFFMWLVV
ncbi:hypothetical protein FNV43_RR19197 [Rhamnella rubrinervis]|uniref:Uncharacterized protein n=1 Tax=Rhamnella rubrinervis TaxID=2594499 RepID=A0A8K0E641_9ROSA|nr:hypothetical protein FNV43_RR19197 [Rhamnella rubrinervis]